MIVIHYVRCAFCIWGTNDIFSLTDGLFALWLCTVNAVRTHCADLSNLIPDSRHVLRNFSFENFYNPHHKTSIMCTIISVYGYKCMYFVGVYCFGTEVSSTNFSLQLTWLVPSSFFFYILWKLYIKQSHRNLPSHKKYDFFSFWNWEGETVSRIEFSVEEKNVMKKEA